VADLIMPYPLHFNDLVINRAVGTAFAFILITGIGRCSMKNSFHSQELLNA
jgi:hypothetical protein